jgi:hypothetical protein
MLGQPDFHIPEQGLGFSNAGGGSGLIHVAPPI